MRCKGGRKEERRKEGRKEGKGEREGWKRTHIQSGVIREEIGLRARTTDARATREAEAVGDAALVEGVTGEGRGGRCFGRGDLGGAAGRPGDVLVGWVNEEVAI
jgi:hypothetical protein